MTLLLRTLRDRLLGAADAPLPKKSDRPADAQIVSFPKCGRTWLRLMIGRALQNHYQLDHPQILKLILSLELLAEIDPRVPKITVYHDDDPQWKTVAELETDKSRFQGMKVIFLVRDPRDVMVSNFFEVKKRVVQYADDMRNWVPEPMATRIRQYEGELDDWLHESWGSFDTIVAYYNIWAEHHHQARAFLLVRYEDLHAQAATELKRIFEFLDIDGVSDAAMAEAVEFAQFQNMRKMETQDTFRMNALRPVDKADEESYKTRKGKVGGFAEYLSDAQQAALEQRMKDTLAPMFGY